MRALAVFGFASTLRRPDGIARLRETSGPVVGAIQEKHSGIDLSDVEYLPQIIKDKALNDSEFVRENFHLIGLASSLSSRTNPRIRQIESSKFRVWDVRPHQLITGDFFMDRDRIGETDFYIMPLGPYNCATFSTNEIQLNGVSGSKEIAELFNNRILRLSSRYIVRRPDNDVLASFKPVQVENPFSVKPS